MGQTRNPNLQGGKKLAEARQSTVKEPRMGGSGKKGDFEDKKQENGARRGKATTPE